MSGSHHYHDLSFLASVPATTRKLEALTDALRDGIRSGRLRGGIHLPPSRTLAKDIGLARSTVAAAYERLTAEGFLTARQGSGTRVSEGMGSGTDLDEKRPRPVPPPAIDSAEIPICRPSLAAFPIAEWRRANAAAARRLMMPGEGSHYGDDALRSEIADYVGRARGLFVRPDDVMVTQGGTQAIRLVFQATLRRGDGVGIEDPGYPLARDLAAACGARPVPVALDHQGARPEAVASGPDVKGLYLTPSHQFPLGMRLPVERRREFLAWAREADAIVVEDDYDSEFRYDAAPLPPLAALDPTLDRVAFIGSFSKSLSPALRLGYVVASADLLHRIARIRRRIACKGQPLVERTMAHFMRAGDLDRHVRRMRRHYATIRRALVDGLTERVPDAAISGADAGLHITLTLPVPLREMFPRHAERFGLNCAPVSLFTAARHPAMSGHVLGYGDLSLDRIEAFLSAL
jgi:GntR family transcriptional regulator/MocR family aminotransferase